MNINKAEKCNCTHGGPDREDHTKIDDGCAWRGCGCTWYPEEEE